MRRAIYCSVLALFLASASGSRGQSEERDDLRPALKLVNSSLASDRVTGYEQLGKLWDSRTQTPHIGFSDTPVQQKLEDEKRPKLPDKSVARIATAIQRGLADKDPKVRKAAAVAICSAPRPRPEVISAIATGLKSDDATVTWYVAQQAVKNLPPIESVIHSLIDKLGSDDFNNYWSASDVLKAYGPKANPYASRIVDAVVKSKTERHLKLYVLYEIGLQGAAAEKLADAATDFTRHELGIAAVSLLDHPDLLTQIESKCPETIPALQDQMPRLYPFLCKHQAVANETRAWLAASNRLLPTTMGLLRKERFIEKITSAEKSATEYEKTLLAACKRACGANPGEQIIVDADHAVEFRPASAWPKTDARRMSKSSKGHGDGATFVMLTGEVRGTERSHPRSIAFFRVNDRMLLGTEQNIQEDILYDASTGRFVYYTSVFAAYSVGAGQSEPGPYQTGSAQTRVEADGYQPLTLRFFDEMPDVIITLTPHAER